MRLTKYNAVSLIGGIDLSDADIEGYARLHGIKFDYHVKFFAESIADIIKAKILLEIEGTE